MKLTKEQIERAKTVNLPQFLMANGFELKKDGKEYVWKEHDSLYIRDNGPGEPGKWFRFSEDKGGDNIAFVCEYMGRSFVQAVEMLNGEHYDRSFIPVSNKPKPDFIKEKELILAENHNCKRVFAYLCSTRGLDYALISELVHEGRIAQEQKTGNVLFKLFDENGKVVGAEKVGTSTEHKFKGIASGSDQSYGFEIVHGNGEKAFFFESAIDLLSYLQMHDTDDCRLISMMGVKPNIVLETMDRYNIPPENIYLCADNDKAGNDFTRRLQEKYPQMKRIAANDRYKDWNDMLRGIPKSTEIEQKKEEKETDMMLTYGNKVWNDATDNRDKTIISMHESNFQQFRDVLEHSGINYFAYAKEDSVIMAVNDKDIDWLRKLLSSDLDTRKSDKDYIPPEKNIIGNAEYRYIPQKEYVSADRDLILKMAELMHRGNIQFSGRIYPTGKGTLTVSHNDLWKVRNIQKSVIDMRRQFSAAEKAQEIGNKDYRANRDTHNYMSKLTPEQFKEIKPFIETSVSYHAIARDGKVAFAVDKENAPAFHRALENAEREVDMLHSIQDLELPMEQMVALSPVIHRLAAEDVQLQLADFFDSRYDEAQFGEMLSLVNDYLNQPIAERYGEHSKLNDMLEAKSSFDRSIELSDFFSQHGFSDEQRAAITAMFVGDVTRGQIDSIDETFTVEDIRDYDELLHNTLQESEIADFLAEHKQAVTDRENAAKEPTEEERVLFGQADLAMFFAECTLSSDEWEDMAYPLFENGYLDKHKPNDKGAFGYHLSEPALYDLAYRYHNGEDIRKELALSLMEHKKTDDIEFVFENGKISDHTYYYAENLRNTLHADFGEDSVKCSFNGMEREVTYSEIGQAFLDRTFEEFNDIAFWWVRDDMTDEIPDISDEAIKQLIAAFDEHTMDGWEKGDNIPKLNRIKKALYDILGDEEQTEKAFACIAKNKYNVTFEAEKPEKQPDSLVFRFGRDDEDDWISESNIVHDFAMAHPDCSFALGNAVFEYLDEKQHTERNIPELNAGWYKKTDFTIRAVINGEEYNYEGRFDIGDGKDTGGGSLIDHIRDYNQGILNYTQYPFNQPEYKERAQHTLDVVIPFLEAHSELTAEEQKIFDNFKAENPVRTEPESEPQQEFKIYQMKSGEEYHYNRFESFENNKGKINIDDYEVVYSGFMDEYTGNTLAEKLESIYAEFNTHLPDNYFGHSLSMSDVIVTDDKAFYVDTIGFAEFPEFFKEKEIVLSNEHEKSEPAVNIPEQKREPVDRGTVTMRKVGDFYEMYGKNAEIGMEVLGLHNTPKNGSPMVGFPDHVKDEYSAKLGEAGYTVLIEQAFELNPPKREVQQLTTLQDVVDKYFGSDCEYAETEKGTWKLAIADGDKVGELFYGGEPVCGIYNRGEKMEIEPYRELSTFPKLLQTAMLEHNPDKPVEIMDFQRTFETPLDKAKYLINSFCEAEYDSEADFPDLHNVGIAYTTLTDDELPFQVTADLIDFKITYEFNGEVYNTELYDSIDDMIKDGLTGLDFDSIISVPDEVIDRHTGEIEDRTTVYLSASAEDLAELREHLSLNGYDVKWSDDSLSFDAESEQIAYIESILEDRDIVYSLDGAAFDNPEQTVSLMSDVSEISDFSSRKDDVKPVTLEFSGDRENLEDIKDKALSLGASASMDNVNGTLSIDTYDNHRDELETLAYKLGVLCKVKEEMISTDIDAPLFTDDAVIDEIQKNEHSSDNKPFWTEPDLRGEQLSLFGDPVPMQTKQEQQKSSGRNRTDEDMKYLRNEIMRGTGFQGGKFRMKQFYDDNKPSVKDFAKKLKDEYGTGGHSGDGEVSFANHDSKGIQIEFNDGTSIDFSWNEAAKLTIELIENEQYITPDDIDRRKKDAKYTVENTNPDTTHLYDQAMLEEAKAILKEYGIEAEYKPNDESTEHISDTEKENSTPSLVSVGDKFRNKATGEVSEVVSLTGALPWYTDQCTVSRASGGFVVTENVSYDKLLNTGLYEYIDSGDIALEHTAPEAEVSDKNKATPDKDNNFNITDTSLGEGGAKTKFKANIAAIETLKMLEEENRPATDEEKETLSKYVGWGGIPQAFDNDNDSWAAEYTQLKELLSPQEYRQANASVLDAFYTSPTVIDGIYEALENFGFEGGNVLEPAMGVGNFFGRMPEEMQKNSQLYGVEIDSISGRIAQKLYPDADIAIQGFEKNNFQNGCFDVAVGNVPFGELGFKDDKHGTNKLHDYFFAETLDKVKDGGIVAFVTSAGTLDKRDETTRQMLADKADFIGAIRLPGGKNGAFKDNAGTEVTTDIIFLQKHNDKTVREMLDVPDWVCIGETADGLPINKYFEQNPDMVLGTVVEGNKLYGSGTMVVADDGFDLQTALHNAVSKLSAQISMDNARDVYAKSEDGIDVKIPSNLRNYSFFEQDNQIFFKKKENVCDKVYNSDNSQFKRAKAFIDLRDTTRDLLEAQELDKPDSVITDLQKQLNTSYDDFYKKYGLIHSQTNKRYFSEDISYNLVAGLEKSYDKNVLKEKSDIFTKRTIIPPKAVDHVETALEALTLSVSEKAQIDFEYMEKLTGMTEDELKHDLTGEIFKVPHTVNDYQTASEYLSGDIRAKLREAEEIAEYDADFNINVSALKSVMPEPLKAGDIDVKIGATWLDPKYYEQFMYELLQTPQFQQSNSPAARWNKSSIIGVEYSDHSNSWHISNKSSDKSVLATQKYGSHKMNAYDILEHILNLKEPKVYKTIEVPDDLGDVKEKRIVDIDATRVVQRKAEDIRKAFKNWIFKDPTRREDIVNRYNELFNSIRPREFDGSALSFPMMNSDIKLHDHQKNAIAHAMFGGNTLFAHSVGAGKTFEMIATAMESKRLGLCTKSLFAVPNHLTDQIGNDFQKLYPSANILVATKKDFKKENRQQLFAKIATGNYDAVIIGHSQLGMIPVSKERQVATIQSQIDDILLGIDELKRQEGSKFQIKAMERTRKSLQKQLDKLDKNHDDTITFEQLGVDKLFIDEAHECTTRS